MEKGISAGKKKKKEHSKSLKNSESRGVPKSKYSKCGSTLLHKAEPGAASLN